MSELRLNYYSDYDVELDHIQRLEESQQFIEDLDTILRDLEDLKEINNTLFGTIKSQESALDNVDNNTEITGNQLDIATLKLKQAEIYQHKYNIKKGILLTAGILIFSFPIGAVIGIKAGIAAGLLGAGSGAGAWYLKSRKI
jgi:hypothetical protein